VAKQADELKLRVRQRVIEDMDFSKDITDDEMLELIDKALFDEIRHLSISTNQRKQVRMQVFYSIRKLDALQELLDDPDVTEIMVNGTDNIFVEKNGSIFKSESRFESEEKLQDVVQQIVASCNRVVNEASPIVDARISGSRINVVLNPIALNGPIITIRRFPENPFSMDDLINLGALSEYLKEYLKVLVKAGYNIFISGGTGSGKTTFLNALSNFIPKDLRLITIEDNAELQIRQVPNLVQLEARNANVEGCKEITIRDLIKSSLRMRPDWIVVGEVRGEETVDMLQAMNTGHMSMSTGHANSAGDMLSRLETMVLMGMEIPLSAVRGQIASGIDIIVHLGRLRDRSRKLLEICELEKELDPLTGKICVNQLFRFEENDVDKEGRIVGSWRKTGELKNTEKLVAAGFKLPSQYQ